MEQKIDIKSLLNKIDALIDTTHFVRGEGALGLPAAESIEERLLLHLKQAINLLDIQVK